MSVARGLLAYAALLAVVCVAVYRRARLEPVDPARAVRIASVWRGGIVVERAVLSPGQVPASPQGPAMGALEVLEGEAPLPKHPLLFAIGLVPGKDGVRARLRGEEAWVTVDDLLSAQAYDHAFVEGSIGLGVGVDRRVVLSLFADRLGTTTKDVLEHAELSRVRLRREVSEERRARPRLDGASLTVDMVRAQVHEIALRLAEGVSEAGHYRYLVDATTDAVVPDYNWPRHSGATFFLAQAARVTHDPRIAGACLRAASLLRAQLLVDCGAERCIADGALADLGSSALALIALTEIDRSGLDGGYRPAIGALSSFLRAQQRPDGEFMHYYDRASKRPVDKQVLYYSGEATLALSLSHRVTGDPEALESARRGLARLGASWSFFGSRYYFGEEHWTCQAMADLSDRARDAGALDFCVRWHRHQRRLQYGPGETPFDAEGAFGVGPVLVPRVTPASSRGEAAGALLLALRKLSPRDPEIPLVDQELRSAIAFVLRQRLGPEHAHLLASPGSTLGRVPGSAVDWRLRIDYEQHAGSAMIRWLELQGAPF